MNEETQAGEREQVDGTNLNDQMQLGEQTPREIAGSPSGSQASRSSSSRRENRIVELLENENTEHSGSDDNWMIGREFYQEDVAADIMDHPMFDDDRESVHSDIERDVVERESSSDGDNLHDLIDMEFIIAPHDEYDTSSDESIADGDGRDNEAQNYDITLPATHRYLGENLEESRGRQILVEGSIQTLHLFMIRNIVLLPGQVLPITTSNLNPRVHNLLKTCITNGSTLIGLMSDTSPDSIGTTADIRNYSNLSDEVKIIMEGRQRFKLISPQFDTAVEGTIRILPEVSLGRCFSCPPSWRKLLTHYTETPYKFIVSNQPKWLVRHHEANSLMRQIKEQIKNWYNGDTQKEANDFSYWVASNLPMSNHERMKILGFNCTEARLLWILNILKRCEFFGCSACKNVICHKKDVFPMSCSGPQNSFVNSHGYVHDTMTVRSTRGLIQEYEWSTEFSWFPGYAWRVACCENCGRHIGWCFKTKSDTKPKKFFGLSRASVRLQERGQNPEPMGLQEVEAM